MRTRRSSGSGQARVRPPTGSDCPFSYGRWDDARARVAADRTQKNPKAAAAYYGASAFDPRTVREALTGVYAPVLLVCGGCEVALPPKRAGQHCDPFPQDHPATHPGAGHSSWLDDARWFIGRWRPFLR